MTVSELARRIRSVIEDEFSFVCITGEISNFKHHSSGHFYFTLKDEKAQISANMWSSRNKELFFTPENGMKVLIKGRVTLYESKGTYQIDVFEMEPSGAGELQVAFERLKQKLFEEGLFDEINKKPLPEFPERVAVITSETGAALQDFIRITQRRYPLIKLSLIHANMQGAGAVYSICSAIRYANQSSAGFEILVLARGGGSVEDLWSFNEEKVAREIFNSKIPVVSAIGHEIDFTISDFVADLRAPTPSAAAEMIFPDRSELIKRIVEYNYVIKNIVTSKISNLKYSLNNIADNYYFRKPIDLINGNKIRLDDIESDMGNEIKRKLSNLKSHLASSEKLLNSLNPDQILKRGFTVIMKDKKIISRKSMTDNNDKIEIKFYDGERKAVISE